MTTYIEKLLHWLYPTGNWGAETNDPKKLHPWGQMWVHLFIGIIAILPVFLTICLFKRWGLIGLLIPAGVPLYREFIHDRHPIKDLWAKGAKAIDCRSDLLSCYVGSAIGLPFVLLCAAVRD